MNSIPPISHASPRRRRRLARLATAGAALTLAATLVGAGAASAHVTIGEGEVVAGSYSLVTVSVPHGCDGSPTTQLRIKIPESITSVTPTRVANWTAETVTQQLTTPITGPHGETITERDAEVVYTATTPLPDDQRDAFALSLQVPADAAGTTLYFPTIQTCEQGETAWIEIPSDGQDASGLAEPSPAVRVVAAAATPSSPSAPAASGGDTTAKVLAIISLVISALTAGGLVAVARSAGRRAS